eukprot:Gb_37798 [translate_table: standard]
MQAGDILVFRQVNNTHFSVQIFGPHACEKQSTSTIDNNRSCLLKEGTLSPICNQKCRILQNPVILCAEQTVIWDAEEKINTQNLLANKHEHDHLASKVLQEESSFCSAVVGQRVKYSQSTCIQKGKQKKSELKSEIKNQLWGQHYSSHTGCPMQFEDLKGPISIKAKRPNFSLVIRKSAVSQGYWLTKIPRFIGNDAVLVKAPQFDLPISVEGLFVMPPREQHAIHARDEHRENHATKCIHRQYRTENEDTISMRNEKFEEDPFVTPCGPRILEVKLGEVGSWCLLLELAILPHRPPPNDGWGSGTGWGEGGGIPPL